MELLLEIKTYKLKLYKRNTTIIGNSASGKTFLAKQLKNKGYIVCEEDFEDEEEIKKRDLSQKVINFFKIEDLVKRNFDSLNYENQAYLLIIKNIMGAKDVLVIDNLLTYLNFTKRNLILTYLKLHNIFLINITNDANLFLINNYMIVLDKQKVAMEGSTELVLKEEKLLYRLGFNLPFILDISSKLKEYKMIKKLCYSNEELRDELWKKTV